MIGLMYVETKKSQKIKKENETRTGRHKKRGKEATKGERKKNKQMETDIIVLVYVYHMYVKIYVCKT